MSALTISRHGATAVLTLDLPGEPVNKLTADGSRLAEFSNVNIARAQQDRVARNFVESKAGREIVAFSDIERLPQTICASLGEDEYPGAARCALSNPLNAEGKPTRTVWSDEAQWPDVIV